MHIQRKIGNSCLFIDITQVILNAKLERIDEITTKVRM